MINRFYFCIFLIIIFFVNCINCFTEHYFYRASYIPCEPRFEKCGLSSVDIQIAGGSTSKARNRCGATVPILSFFLQSDTNREIFKALNNLFKIVPSACEQRLVNGKFSLFETNITLTQNLKDGIFLQYYLPIRASTFSPIYKIKNQVIFDQMLPINQIYSYKSQLNKLNKITKKSNESGFADMVLLLGVTKNYQDTCYLDFVDATLQTGLLLPTGKRKNPANLFSIPYGYGAYAIPLNFDASIGAYNWLTYGIHFDALLFIKRNKHFCSPKLTRENSLVFQKNNLCIKPGNLWSFGSYIKSDHFICGFSLWLGISYVQKYWDEVSSYNRQCIENYFSSNPNAKKWSMLTFHFMTDYDFAQEGFPIGPRIAIFYNYQILGKRVLKTSMLGGTFGTEINWCY